MKIFFKILIIVGLLGLFFWKVDWHLSKPAKTQLDVTLIEGWTAKQMAKQLAKSNLVLEKDFLNLVKKPPVIVKQNHPELVLVPDLEGFLFPDTYRFYGSSTPEEVVGKLVDNFFKRLPTDWSELATKQDLNLYQVVTLASIIEKEVANDQDRRIVADIFLKRLKDNKPLQSDATVNYVTGNNSLQPSAQELAMKSPYNTYDNLGLPPGPINNPSLSAIMAVLKPEANKYFYFLTTPQGVLKPAVTYVEHLANKRQFLR